MTDGWLGGDLARETNDLFAHAYDDFNCRYQNTRWTARLLEQAQKAGLSGDHLLDVGCGTGLSFIPMLRRGWSVTACDISPEMVELARKKVGDLAVLRRADMRELPVFGRFDLVWALKEAVNYLLSEQELRAALMGMRANLAPEGVLLFDVNTLATYRRCFAEQVEVQVRGRRLVWTGRMRSETVQPGLIAEARFEAIGEPESVHMHHQRHFPESVVLEAVDAVGLKCVGILGASDPEGNLSDPLDEEVHSKGVYVCKAA